MKEINVTLNGQTVTLPVEQDFTLDDQAIDAEACKMGKLLMFYGDLFADMRTQVTRSKQAVELYYSEFAKNLRQVNRGATHKLTEGAIKEAITADPGYQTRLESLNVTENDSNKIEHFYRSLYKKADLIIAIVYKQKAEIAKMGSIIP